MEAVWLRRAATVRQQGVSGGHEGQTLGTGWRFDPAQSRPILALPSFQGILHAVVLTVLRD